ncbi:MAG: AMP-binding protein, partial [Firmicutes bacterium]|nr:AMP-binding protein [Bacillota bacterium]
MYLSQTVLRAAQVNPAGVAVIFEGLQRTWSDFAERVARMAGALLNAGVKPGDRVAVLAENSDRYVELYYSIPWAGAVIVPLNARWTHSELRYAIDDAGISLLFIDEACIDNMAALLQACPALTTVILLNDNAASPAASSYPDYETFLSTAAAVEPRNEDPESLYGIFYTGGTTGQSKGVMLSNRGLWANASYIVREYDCRVGDIVAHVAPMYHMAAGANLLATTNAAATHCVLRRFEPDKVLDAIERDGIVHLPMVPTMIAMLLDTPGLQQRDLSSVKRIIYGAAPMSESLLTQLMSVFPDLALLQVYGQTEMSPVVTTLGPDCHRPFHPLYAKRLSVGQPTYATTVRIVDKQGRDVKTGDSGEILAKGPGA